VSEDGVPRRAVCPGSFDPITLGHLDVITRAAGLFDEVIVALFANPAKPGRFALQRRLELVGDAVAGLANVRAELAPPGLLVDYCAAVGAQALVKGVRGSADVDYELPMAVMNRQLAGVETVFLAADPALIHVSSSLVKEVAGHGGDVSRFVTPAVLKALSDGPGALPDPG
jgi:pantetheine-phosphate adenylyltransferase